MIVSRQYTRTRPTVKIPQSQRLIVRGGKYPGEFGGVGMKLDRTNAIQKTQQRKETPRRSL